MPLHLSPLSRRSFLAATAAALGATRVLPATWGAENSRNPNRFALLSDTHIPENADIIARDVNMTANLKKVIREVIALTDRPAAVMINGDCAYNKGMEADYRNLSDCLAPFSEAGLPLHLTMGNHDNREALYSVLTQQKPQQPLVESKHLTILESPHANWFLLDSLMQTNVTPGLLGPEQRTWLAAELDARPDKPALVMAHHTPQFQAPPEGKSWGGLTDTAELMELLLPRKQVKAFIFGHSHHWNVSQQEGMHLINLPPVAYVFAAGRPNGWVDALLKADGMVLELHALETAHPEHAQKTELAWR